MLESAFFSILPLSTYIRLADTMQLLSLFSFVALASAAAVPVNNLEERQTCPNANAAALSRAKTEFQKAKIVPDVIPQFNPTLEVSIDYNGKAVNFGNTFNTVGKLLQVLNSR